jgi:beta-phosphoglucomutase family hydrolase
MSDYKFDAVIFDLDGVVTDTAAVHSRAWKQMFDEFLKNYSEETGQPFREFTHYNDYLPYVDGKPRYKGVASFLKSREIELLYGNPEDDPHQKTICGLGNRKDELFNQQIDQGNLVLFDSTVAFIKELLNNNIKVGVASSSKNCERVLQATGLLDLFETRVDGLVAAQLGLKGKPEPDIFSVACENLSVTCDKAVVVEDAVSGVQAGYNGQFGLVLGIAREDNEQELKKNGADIVVSDMSQITLADVEKWFAQGLKDAQWTLSYYDYCLEHEGTREALCTVGNGYIGTRGALEESKANGINYPGTYMAGLYNRLTSKIDGREVVNEDFVNCPNWLPLTFKIGAGKWLNLNETEVKEFKRRLDFRNGSLHRKVIVKDGHGNETLIQSMRIVSMADPHLAGILYKITPLNYDNNITVLSELDGQVINSGVERYKQLNSKHWQTLKEGAKDRNSFIVLQTNQSKIKIALAAKLLIKKNNRAIESEINIISKAGVVYSTVQIKARKNQSVTIEKIVAIHSSQETDNPLQSAQNNLDTVDGFKKLREESKAAWSDIWGKIDIKIEGQRLVQKLVRLNLYHSIITASPHNTKIDAGIPARGLHGEAYRGHIFWDEIFILPLYFMHFPEIAKSVLLYRYRRLDKARDYAKEHGYRGAMFPWQSGSDGGEETQVMHLNPISGIWGADYSSLQRHISLAIAFNVYQYYQFTNDLDFLEKYGAEIFLEICRFWASMVKYNKKTQRYDIAGVMGPDEYHEVYPRSEKVGINNNTYTNLMAIWTFKRAFDILDLLKNSVRQILFEKINLTKKELDEWRVISTKLKILISKDNILEQFEGFFDLNELDWDRYIDKYGNISRLDRILKAEGKNPNEYKVIKQADALMAFYNLSVDEVYAILRQRGLSPENDLLSKNFRYYMKRTSHGSTLSKLVHSYIASLAADGKLSYKLYTEALKSDYQDIQGGTTKEGIHSGVMAGSAVLALKNYAGFSFKEECICINPKIPSSWKKLRYNLKFKGKNYYFIITPHNVRIKADAGGDKQCHVYVYGQKVDLVNNRWKVIRL